MLPIIPPSAWKSWRLAVIIIPWESVCINILFNSYITFRDAMRAKFVVIVLLIAVIAGLLVVTSAGNSLFGNIDVFRGLSSFLNIGSKDHFQMQLVANKDAFIGKSFELSNTTMYLNGICVGSVYVFGANIAKEGRCDILLEGVKGKVEYSSIGTLEGSIEAGQVQLDGSVIAPASDRRVRFSVVPTDMFVSNYNSNSVSLPVVTGEVTRFKEDGSQDQLKTLIDEKVEIFNYIGNVRLNVNHVVLSGFATKVNWFS